MDFSDGFEFFLDHLLVAAFGAMGGMSRLQNFGGQLLRSVASSRSPASISSFTLSR